MRSLRNAIVIGFAIGLGLGQARSGEFDSILHWRNIGPYRGGRTRAICGVPSQPNVFYMAPVNGGVFKSNDYGRTWQPIFDDQPTASSILNFCRRWGIAPSTFYEWMASGHAPRTLRIGPKRRVITAADEAAWVAEREREAAQ